MSPASGVPREPPARAGLLRRLASLVYECLVVLALLLVASLLFLPASPEAASSPLRPLFQGYLASIIGLYCTWFWTHGGQTPPMRAWKLRLVRRDGGAVTWPQALLRFLLAFPSIGLAGAGLLWALVDRERQFVHDRLAGTRIVRSEE
jgi:uncharacterized RDD family membrane protein YckC